METAAHTPGPGQPNIPVPDPSALTVVQIEKAINGLHAQIGEQLAALRDVLTTRFDANDKASIVLAENLNRVPTLLDREIARVIQLFTEKLDASSKLNDEKFLSIDLRFKERDVRTEQEKVAVSTAVSAAFSAQKESSVNQDKSNAASISKSDAATAKQLEDMKSLFNSRDAATGDKINLLGERMTRMESGASGAQKFAGTMMGGISLAVVLVGGVIGLITFMSHQSGGNMQPAYVAVAPTKP